ncbi:MAG: hypothetical protein EBZ49_03855, partial [Proteobacteria bacterium]|nr:hypothetical protein [Pseudomonadota bacterium]
MGGNQISLIPNSRKCIDINGNDQRNGTQLQLWDCNDSAAQKFFYDTKNFQIKTPLQNKCFDVTNGSRDDGTKIELWDCDPNNQNQKFGYDPSTKNWVWIGGIGNTIPCIVPSNNSYNNGTILQIQDCYLANTITNIWNPLPDSGITMIHIDPAAKAKAIAEKQEQAPEQQAPEQQAPEQQAPEQQ